MSLNAVTLAAALAPDIKSAFIDGMGAVDNPALTAFCTLLATKIATNVVTHVTTNAVVSGVATGAMAGGPGVPVVGTIT